MGTMIFTSQASHNAMSPIRALHSLCEHQAVSIVAGLASLTAEWDIERHESCDEHLSLVLIHRTHEAAIIIDRDRTGMHVSLMVGDELHTNPNCFSKTSDVLTAVREIFSVTTAVSAFGAGVFWREQMHHGRF